MRAGVNESTGTEGPKKIYVGAFNMHVTAVNPNKAELEKMGINAKEEPDYFIRDKDDKTKVLGVQVRFFLENMFREETVKTTVSFFLRKEFLESKKDPQNIKYNYIDERGSTIFLTDAVVASKSVPYDWIHVPSLKKAVKGEPELIDFLRNLTNPEREQPTYFENQDMKKLFSGDVSEIRNLVKQANDKGNAVRVMLLPRINGSRVIQYVFDQKFDRAWSSSSKYIHKQLVSQRQRLEKGGVITSMISEDFTESQFFIREVDHATVVIPALPGIPAAHHVPAGTAQGSETDISDLLGVGDDDDLPF